MVARQPFPVGLLHFHNKLDQRPCKIPELGIESVEEEFFSARGILALRLHHRASHAPPYAAFHSGFAATFARNSSSSFCFLDITVLSNQPVVSAFVSFSRILQAEQLLSRLPGLLGSQRRILLEDRDPLPDQFEDRGFCDIPFEGKLRHGVQTLCRPRVARNKHQLVAGGALWVPLEILCALHRLSVFIDAE